jgi:hypothetical protein
VAVRLEQAYGLRGRWRSLSPREAVVSDSVGAALRTRRNGGFQILWICVSDSVGVGVAVSEGVECVALLGRRGCGF